MATMNGDPSPDRQTETIRQLDAPGKIEKGKIEKGDGLPAFIGRLCGG
jgi:hypothetical protein